MRISDWSSDVCSSNLALTVDVTDVDDTINLNLDTDTDADLNTAAAFDGAAGAAVFAEDANVGNNAHIANFGSDDVILVSNGAPDDYSFGEDANGIVISFATPGGQASEIHTDASRSEEQTSELQSLMRTLYAVTC